MQMYLQGSSVVAEWLRPECRMQPESSTDRAQVSPDDETRWSLGWRERERGRVPDGKMDDR